MGVNIKKVFFLGYYFLFRIVNYYAIMLGPQVL